MGKSAICCHDNVTSDSLSTLKDHFHVDAAESSRRIATEHSCCPIDFLGLRLISRTGSCRCDFGLYGPCGVRSHAGMCVFCKSIESIHFNDLGYSTSGPMGTLNISFFGNGLFERGRGSRKEYRETFEWQSEIDDLKRKLCFLLLM